MLAIDGDLLPTESRLGGEEDKKIYLFAERSHTSTSGYHERRKAEFSAEKHTSQSRSD